MSTAIAKNLMAEMKLLGMFAAYDRAVTDATRDQTGYSEFLDTLLQAETDYRQERKTGYRIKSAKFTLRPAFEDIDFTASRSISKAQIKELYSLQWLNEGRPVLLIGQTGVGKTFLAQAIGLHVCACGRSVLYMTVTTWLENVVLARHDQGPPRARCARHPDHRIGRSSTGKSCMLAGIVRRTRPRSPHRRHFPLPRTRRPPSRPRQTNPHRTNLSGRCPRA